MADLSLDQIAEGKPVRIEKDGKTICVARVGDEVFAVADTCTHSDASLSGAKVEFSSMKPALDFESCDIAFGQ